MIRLKKHNFDLKKGAFFHEEVVKEEFTFKEKKGEITYKVIVKIRERLEFDFCKVKILYAELDGKEMKLNGSAWKEIQKNCTIKESLRQNCVIRDGYPDMDFDDSYLNGALEFVENEMSTNDADIKAADETHDLLKRKQVRQAIIAKSAKAAAFLERYIGAADKARDCAKRYRDYQKHVEKQLPAIEADLAEKCE